LIQLLTVNRCSEKRRKLSHDLDRTKCRDTQIFEYSCKESGRADLKEAFVGVPISKRPQVDDVQYLRVSNRILKGASNEGVLDGVVAEVAMSGVI
jgi:hypothetical protein